MESRRLAELSFVVLGALAGCSSGSETASNASDGAAPATTGGAFSAGGSSGNPGTGGATGTGATLGGGGAANSGGRSSGSGGSTGSGGSECGPCDGPPPARGIHLTIAPDAAAGRPVVPDLTVTSPGLTFSCDGQGTPCAWSCASTSPVPDGDHQVTISAAGFQSVTLDVLAAPPAGCGCCGSCAFYYSRSVTLEPSGSLGAGCCANLQSDPYNCGKCARACLPGSSCNAGKCRPSIQGCLSQSAGFTTCNDYCASLGQACLPGCGASDAAGALVWAGNATCGGTYKEAACADALLPAASMACCCGDP